MRSNVIEQYKLTLSLSKTQRSIIAGTLLGDGHLETQDRRHTYRLKIEHSSKQDSYVMWLYEELKNLVNTPPKSKRKILGEVEHENYYFQTLSLNQLRFYGQQFYDASGHKKVPRQIRRWLTPLAMAVWFMDDGSIKSKQHRALILNTQCFDKADIALLRDALQANFAVDARVRMQKEGPQLLIVGASAERLVAVMRPYVLPELTYKFGLLDQVLG
jgi:recombination protein RecA